jgi:hypothetical protein
MLGNVGRHRRWPWAILFLLFALTCVWSYVLMEDQVGDQVADDWSSILQIGSAVAAGIALVLLILTSISTRRRRRRERKGGSEMTADEQQPGEESPTEKAVPTYEEVFGLELDPDQGSLLRAPKDEEWPGDEAGDEPADEGAESEVEAQPWAEQLPAAPTAEEDGQDLDADLDEEVDEVHALDADGDSEEHLRRMREEFKARAEEAALRVKQREAGLHEAASAPDPKR